MSQRVLITGASGFIGTNLAAHYLAQGAQVMNFDKAPPKNEAHKALWRHGDLRDREALAAAFRDFKPDLVLHAGARADIAGKLLSDYTSNTDGTRNLVDVATQTPSVRKVVNFSTMLVCRLGYQPTHDEDYRPNNAYGVSKVEGERIFRTANAPFAWSIVRPTSIWGPWFGSPYRAFFAMVCRGLYVHPRGRGSQRNYGYIGNVVKQIATIAESEQANRGTFYVGDYAPIDVRDWGNEIAAQCGRPPIRELPSFLFSMGAAAGDMLQKLGWADPPLSSRRFNNLLTMAIFDMSATQALCPELPYDMKGGVAETLAWMKTQRRDA